MKNIKELEKEIERLKVENEILKQQTKNPIIVYVPTYPHYPQYPTYPQITWTTHYPVCSNLK